MRVNDAIAGLVLIALAAFMIYLTLSFPAFPGQKYGPSLFPRILGSGLIVCGTLIALNGLASRRAGHPWVEVPGWARQPYKLASFFLVLAVILVYILVSETVGFLLTASLSLAVMFLWFGVRPITALPIAFATTVLIQWFFGTLMRIPLPRGWLPGLF